MLCLSIAFSWTMAIIFIQGFAGIPGPASDIPGPSGQPGFPGRPGKQGEKGDPVSLLQMKKLTLFVDSL